MQTNSDFFKQDQQQWFEEYTYTELPETLVHTNPHPENFTFEDVPF